MEQVWVIFDGPPSHESGRFVEVETPDGKGVGLGEHGWEPYPRRVSGLYRLGPFVTGVSGLFAKATRAQATIDELAKRLDEEGGESGPVALDAIFPGWLRNEVKLAHEELREVIDACRA